MHSFKRLTGVSVVVVLALIGCAKKKRHLPDLGTQELKRLAEKGDAAAAHQMGMRYGGGHKADKNEAEAVKWYRMAAEKGFTPSQFELGFCYYKGRGVAKDKEKARKWFKKAASYSGDSEEYQFFADQAKRRLKKM